MYPFLCNEFHLLVRRVSTVGTLPPGLDWLGLDPAKVTTVYAAVLPALDDFCAMSRPLPACC